MADETRLDFASLQAIITTEIVNVHGSELHGVLAGLVCAGYSFDQNDHIGMITDMFNNGEKLPGPLKSSIQQMFTEICSAVLDESYSFQLLLPDDDETMAERGHALSAWVQGFNLGFGLQQKDNAVASEDVKEVLKDFAEIANLSDEVEEDEASEQAYFEIGEYVRISALLCFSELGAIPDSSDDDTPPTILH
jgi:uncharacterized protein YgfB (UPF0149 family)